MRRTGVAALVPAGLAVSPATAATLRWTAALRAFAVTLVLAALAAPAATAAKPHWILKGKVTRLTHHAITVHGKTCTITPSSPKPWIHVDIVGSTVEIVCSGGVLLTIDLAHSGSSSAGQSGQSVTTGSNVTSSSNVVSSSSSSTGASGAAGASALALAGDFTVTAVGNGSISVQGSSSHAFTCKVDSSSPDVSSFHVGGHVAKMTCRNDVLTSIA
jgi:hypothetical protein